MAKLDALRFVWRLGDVAWEAQLAKLVAYKTAHGDCKVPRQTKNKCRTSVQQVLFKWTDNQRQAKHKLDLGKPASRITAARVAKLDALGFPWSLKIGCGGNDAGMREGGAGEGGA